MTSILRRAAGLALLCLAAAATAAAEPIDRYLPSDTLAHLRLSNGKQVAEALSKTGAGRLLAEQEVQRLIEEISDSMAEDISRLEDQLGYKLTDLLKLFDGGEASLTLTGLALTAKNPVLDRLMFTVETGGYDKRWRKLRDWAFDQVQTKNENAKVTKYELKQCEVVALRLAGVTLSTAFYKGRYIVSTDVTAMIQLLSRLDAGAGEDSLGKNAKYAKLSQQTTRGRPGLFLYVDTEGLMNQVFRGVTKAAEARDTLHEIGVDQIKAVGVSSCVTDRGFVETIQIHAPKATRGVFGLIDGLPAGDGEMMQLAPAKSVLTVTGAVNPLQTWMDYYALVRDLSPEAYKGLQDGLARFEKSLGSKVTDVLRPLGKRFLLYLTMPPHEGLSPDLVLLWELSDPAAAKKQLATLIARMTRTGGDEEQALDIRKVPFADSHFHYTNLSRLGQQQVIAPSWAVRGKYLVLSHSPNGLKQAWTRLEEGGQKLVDTERFKTMRSQLSPAAGGLVYFDAGRLVTATYETFVSFFQAVIPKGDVPFEPALLPRPALLAKHTYGVGIGTYKTENGLRIELASPVGVVPFAVFAGGIAALQQIVKDQGKGPFGLGQKKKMMPRITFAFDDMTLAAALDIVARKTGVAIHFPRETCAGIKVSAKSEGLPLPEALRKLIPAAQLSHRVRKLPDGKVQIIVYPAPSTSGGAR